MTARLQPKTARGRRGLLSSEDIVSEKLTYTNNTRSKRELVEEAIGDADPGHLHTFPLASGESIELPVREGVRRRWRKYRPEGLK